MPKSMVNMRKQSAPKKEEQQVNDNGFITNILTSNLYQTENVMKQCTVNT